MQTEITKELRARIFGLYIGSPVQAISANNAIIEGPLLDIYQADEPACRIGGNDDWWIISEEAKLLLTKPENITDADAIEVFDIVGSTVNTDSTKVKIVKNWIKYSLDYELADFLRSKSYGINYMGINLFDAGIAIEKPSPVK